MERENSADQIVQNVEICLKRSKNKISKIGPMLIELDESVRLRNKKSRKRKSVSIIKTFMKSFKSIEKNLEAHSSLKRRMPITAKR